MSAPVVPPLVPHAPVAPTPPTPRPAAPIPPAAKKPLAEIKKSDFEREIDAFNAVTDCSWLTHQNVDRLMHDAFVKSGREEAAVSEMTRAGSIDICAIDNRSENIDYILRDAVLKFIGQEDSSQQNCASIALCSGGHRDPVTGHVSGGAHWTALHLRRVTDPATGLTTIQAFTMDSGGNRNMAPAAVGRVLSSIANNRKDIMDDLDDDAQDNKTFLRAAAVLQNSNFKLEERAIVLECKHQNDGYSCGYHAVFNLVNMASRDDVKTNADKIKQGSDEVDAKAFIANSKVELVQIFPAPSRRRAVPKTASDPSRVAPKQDPKNEVTSIVFDDNLTRVEKLEKLIAIEERLAKAEEIITLSNLQIERHYGRIVSEIGDSLQQSLLAVGSSKTELLKTLLEILSDPKISQDPKIILEPLKSFYTKSSPEIADFETLTAGIEAKLKEKEGDEKETTWQTRYEKLCEFLRQNKTNFPESLAIVEDKESEDVDDLSEEEFHELLSNLQSAFSLEQRKQKIFKSLDLIDLEHAKDEPNYRELKIGETYYGLEKDDSGIRVVQSAADNNVESFSEVDPAKIDDVLYKMEEKIIVQKTSRMKDGKLVQGADGSVTFTVTTLVDSKQTEEGLEPTVSWQSRSPNQTAKEKAARISEKNAKAQDGEEKWEVIGDSEKRIEMAKSVTLQKDDAMWKKDGDQIKLVGEFGTEKKSKLDSEIMRIYLHDHVGKNVEETKKRYGVTNTTDKPNPIISNLISARALKLVKEREVVV